MSEFKKPVEFLRLFFTFFSIILTFAHFFRFFLAFFHFFFKKSPFFSSFQLTAVAAKNRTKCASMQKQN